MKKEEIIKSIKESWKAFRLKHHSCTRNSVLVDSYTSSAGSITSGVSWQTSIYKCKICGKRFDVD